VARVTGTNTWKQVGQNRNGVPYSEPAWEQQGVDHGNGTKPILLWYIDREHVVFKIPSGKHWASLLQPSVSHPGHFHVARLVEDIGGYDGHARVIRSEHMFDMKVSAKGRA